MIKPGDLKAHIEPLANLKLYPGNARQHDGAAIRASLLKHGQFRPLGVQASTGLVLMGNGTLEQMFEMGWTEASVIRLKVTDAEAKRILLVDNRSNDLASYDDQALVDLLESLTGDFDGSGFEQEDLDALLASLAETEAPKIDVDHETTLPVPSAAETVTQLGDMWEVGGHRIICGDALDPRVLEVAYSEFPVGCLLTDPPYGMNLDTDWSTISGKKIPMMQKVRGGKYPPVIGDDQPFDATVIAEYFAPVAEQFWFGADYYRRTIPYGDLEGSWLVWDKRNESSDAGFGSGFELIWSRTKHKRDLLRFYYFGAFGAEARNREHPTQKPSMLLAEILNRWAEPACVVADPFLGSGSTLIAAARSGRMGIGIELNPSYVDVAVRRLEDLLGIKGERKRRH